LFGTFTKFEPQVLRNNNIGLFGTLRFQIGSLDLMQCRFYFHLTNGEDVIHDEGGIQVSDLQAALTAAMEVIQELKAEDPTSTEEWQGWRLEITDEAGRVVESLALNDPLSAHCSRH
jgi:hypothetical protein